MKKDIWNGLGVEQMNKKLEKEELKIKAYGGDLDAMLELIKLNSEEIMERLEKIEGRASKSEIFVGHVQNHLKEDEKVICKICGKTIDEIYEEEK